MRGGDDPPHFFPAFMDEQTKQGLIYAMRLLAISKKSEVQIREKLAGKGYSANAITQVIGELKSNGILDDLKFAKEKIYWATHGNLIGKRRLEFELRRKGIKKDTIAEALQEFSVAEERERAFSLAKIQADKLKAIAPLQKRKRLYDFLIRRGFDYEICRDVIEEIGKNAQND